MTETEFNQLAAQGYNRIPLTLERYADLDTPLSVYLKLAHKKDSFLLESVIGGERFGRYSIVGLPATTRIECDANTHSSRIIRDGVTIETDQGNPLEFLERYQQRIKAYIPNGFPRFCGGLAGYFAYDTVRFIERRLAQCPLPDEINVPDILLLQTESVAVIDNLSRKIWLIVFVDPGMTDAWQQGQAKLVQLDKALQMPYPPLDSAATTSAETQRDFHKPDYLAAVNRAKDYIMQGDMMQVQIGQRIKKSFAAAPINLYRALRTLNPSPYMFYYDFGDFQVVGASPEILVREETSIEIEGKKRITIRPLAGTRPRGSTRQHDERLAKELLADPKEIAEHVMLIDLARNDIGRIAEIGSVRVTEEMAIERYSHVMHIVSNVEGILQAGLSNLDVLKATFPAGTLSGAPKVRAMEIIDELEPVKRGVYGGACGYLSYSGDMDLAIAIRTAIIKDKTLYVQAAAGVVADSIAENEWQETENKALALLRAAELAENGLL